MYVCMYMYMYVYIYITYPGKSTVEKVCLRGREQEMRELEKLFGPPWRVRGEEKRYKFSKVRSILKSPLFGVST